MRFATFVLISLPSVVIKTKLFMAISAFSFTFFLLLNLNKTWVQKQCVYGAALGLYNSHIVKLINKKGKLKSSIIIDELPTIYFKGLDNLIDTARSNKVAVLLGIQDFSQLKRDYGDKEATVVMNTVGNIFR